MTIRRRLLGQSGILLLLPLRVRVDLSRSRFQQLTTAKTN